MNIHDGGEYSCEVETDDAEPTAVVHTVEILGKAWIMENFSLPEAYLGSAHLVS